MARIAVNVAVAAASNPVHPSLHAVTPATPGAETTNVYVSYDTTKISGYQQLHSAVMAALGGLANGNFAANS